jgi:hypothetical protein
MRQLQTHLLRTLAALLLLAFGFFMLSASGQDGAGWEDGPTWLGNLGWFAFLITALAFVVAGVYTLVRRTRSRRTA